VELILIGGRNPRATKERKERERERERERNRAEKGGDRQLQHISTLALVFAFMSRQIAVRIL
jgi:hypothetical protein